MGESSKNILLNYSFADLQETLTVYNDKCYIILVDIYKRQIYICFQNGETTDTVLEAYFHSVCLGIATCIYNEMDLVSSIYVSTFCLFIILLDLQFFEIIINLVKYYKLKVFEKHIYFTNFSFEIVL